MSAAAPTPGQTPANGNEIHLSIATDGLTAPVQLQFNTIAGRSYTVQVTDNLSGTTSTTPWQTLQTVTASSATTTVQDPTPPNLPQRYYRVLAN